MGTKEFKKGNFKPTAEFETSIKCLINPIDGKRIHDSIVASGKDISKITVSFNFMETLVNADGNEYYQLVTDGITANYYDNFIIDSNSASDFVESFAYKLLFSQSEITPYDVTTLIGEIEAGSAELNALRVRMDEISYSLRALDATNKEIFNAINHTNYQNAIAFNNNMHGQREIIDQMSRFRQELATQNQRTMQAIMGLKANSAINTIETIESSTVPSIVKEGTTLDVLEAKQEIASEGRSVSRNVVVTSSSANPNERTVLKTIPIYSEVVKEVDICSSSTSGFQDGSENSSPENSEEFIIKKRKPKKKKTNTSLKEEFPSLGPSAKVDWNKMMTASARPDVKASSKIFVDDLFIEEASNLEVLKMVDSGAGVITTHFKFDEDRLKDPSGCIVNRFEISTKTNRFTVYLIAKDARTQSDSTLVAVDLIMSKKLGVKCGLKQCFANLISVPLIRKVAGDKGLVQYFGKFSSIQRRHFSITPGKDWFTLTSKRMEAVEFENFSLINYIMQVGYGFETFMISLINEKLFDDDIFVGLVPSLDVLYDGPSGGGKSVFATARQNVLAKKIPNKMLSAMTNCLSKCKAANDNRKGLMHGSFVRMEDGKFILPCDVKVSNFFDYCNHPCSVRARAIGFYNGGHSKAPLMYSNLFKCSHCFRVYCSELDSLVCEMFCIESSPSQSLNVSIEKNKQVLVQSSKAAFTVLRTPSNFNG